jgi:GTPase SAR1 family protein
VEIISVTKEEFEQYEKVKLSGKTNMFDTAKIEELTGLSPNKTRYIMLAYSKLKEQFKNENRNN